MMQRVMCITPVLSSEAVCDPFGQNHAYTDKIE